MQYTSQDGEKKYNLNIDITQKFDQTRGPPFLVSVTQGKRDQVKIGSFTAETRKCHRPHHPLPGED